MAMTAMKATKKGVLKRIKAQKSLGKTIKVGGKKFDKEMILAARRATRGANNVLVSKDDAKQIFEAARPTGNTGQSSYDKIEKATMAYIRKTYKFTPAADALLRKLVAKAAGRQAKRTKAMKRARSAEDSASKLPNVAVVLAGCGVYDGSEITEAVAVLIHLGGKANVQCFAPDEEMYHVIDHTAGGESKKEKRNVLVESARISRGNCKPLKALKAAHYDGVIIPGGFGAAKNLSSFGYENEKFSVDPDVARIVREFHKAKKVQGYCCIASVIPAKVLKATVTMGGESEEDGKWPYAGATGAVKAVGGAHVQKPLNVAHFDEDNKVVTSAAYMCGTARPDEVFKSVGAMVQGVLQNIK